MMTAKEILNILQKNKQKKKKRKGFDSAIIDLGVVLSAKNRIRQA